MVGQKSLTIFRSIIQVNVLFLLYYIYTQLFGQVYHWHVKPVIPIELMPYDPRWPQLYEQARRGILGVIAPYVTSIEHIGSTAVPGLAAKPVIDILIGVCSLQHAPTFLPPLYPLGYTYITEHEDVFPERRYLHRIVDGAHTHHLHMVEPESDFYRVQLLFRDYLREHPVEAQRYAALKVHLARQYRFDREAYTDGKTAFIKNILQKAGDLH